MSDELHRIGNIFTTIDYRTDEVLSPGSEIAQTRSIIVGQNQMGKDPKSAPGGEGSQIPRGDPKSEGIPKRDPL